MVEIPGKFRIRISSIEPNLLNDDIIELTASNDKMCKHFHIPLQSGSSEILRMMKRRYTVEDYRTLINKVNTAMPGIGIGVDVIVGFPGETENEFLETYNFLRDLNVSYLHVFTYSERPDTVAADLAGQVDVFERKRRNNILRKLSVRKRNLFYNQNLGKQMEVLFEAENYDGLMKGFSSNYVRVSAGYNPDYINTLSMVRFDELRGSECKGKITAIKKSVDSLAS